MVAVKCEAADADLHSNSSNRMHALLLLVVLPFCYGAATRIPFTFVAVHALDRLYCGLPMVAVVLGAYQVSRVLSNCLVGVLGSRVSLVFGAASGLLGYTLITASALARYASTSSDSARYSSTGRWSVDLCWLVANLALVGLSEQIVALQDFCKATYQQCNVTLRQKLLLLYASNVCGTSVGFLLSGVTYHLWGLAGAGALGMLMEGMLLLGSAIYCTTVWPSKGSLPAHSSTMQPWSSDDEGPGQRQPSLLDRAASGALALTAPPPCLMEEWAVVYSGAAPRQQHFAGQGNEFETGDHVADASTVSQRGGNLAAALNKRRRTATSPLPPMPRATLTQQHHHHHQQQGKSSTEVPASRHMASTTALSHQPSGSARTATEQDGDGGLARPPWISYVIAAAFCNQALLIGVILSSAPLYMALHLKLQVLHVGLAFGVGEALGSAALLYTSSAPGQARFRQWLPMPLSMLVILATMGVASVLLPLLPGKAAAIACLVAIMGLNDVGTSLCAEAQGATLPERHYRRMNALGNILRRAGNTCTCIIAPLLFQLSKGAPFVLFGALTLAWVVLLAALFGWRAQELHHVSRRCATANDGHTDDECSSTVLPGPWKELHRYAGLSFVSMERKYWEQQLVGAQPRAAT